MEWYEDSLIKFIDNYTAPNNRIDLTENANFISFKQEYISELKTMNNDKNSNWYNKFHHTISMVNDFFDILKRFFFTDITINTTDFLAYIRNTDIQEYHLGYYYRVVGGNTKNKTFYRGKDLYCKPKEFVDKEGRYNSTNESTMYLSEQALLCWQECNMPSFFTLCKFVETDNNHLRYFCVKSSKQIQDEANLNYIYDEKQFALIHHYIVLNPLYLLLSQRINECTTNYTFSNRFLKWTRQEKICDGILYCNCADYYDGRVFDKKKLKYSKNNIAIPTEIINVDELIKCFKIEKTNDYDLEEEMEGVNDTFEKIRIIKKHFERNCVYV